MRRNINRIIRRLGAVAPATREKYLFLARQGCEYALCTGAASQNTKSTEVHRLEIIRVLYIPCVNIFYVFLCHIIYFSDNS